MTNKRGLLGLMTAAMLITFTGCDKTVDVTDKNIKTVCSSSGHCVEFLMKDYTFTKDTNSLEVQTIADLANIESITPAYDLLELTMEENLALHEKFDKEDIEDDGILNSDRYNDYIDSLVENNQTKILTFSYKSEHKEVNIPDGDVKYGSCGQVGQTDKYVYLSTGAKYPSTSQIDSYSENSLLILNLDTLVDSGIISLDPDKQKDFCIYQNNEVGLMGGAKMLELSNTLVYSAEEINDILTSEDVI